MQFTCNKFYSIATEAKCLNSSPERSSKLRVTIITEEKGYTGFWELPAFYLLAHFLKRNFQNSISKTKDSLKHSQVLADNLVGLCDRCAWWREVDVGVKSGVWAW